LVEVRRDQARENVFGKLQLLLHPEARLLLGVLLSPNGPAGKKGGSADQSNEDPFHPMTLLFLAIRWQRTDNRSRFRASGGTRAGAIWPMPCERPACTCGS